MVCKGAAPPCNPTNYLLFLTFGWGETECVYCVVCEILCGLDLLPVYHRLRTFVPAGSLPRLKLRTAYAFFYRLGHPPSFYSGIFPTAVINYFALYSEAGSLPRLKLRTAYAFFYRLGHPPSFYRSKLLTTCNPCIPLRLFKATLQRIAANLRAGCADAHTAH